MPTKKHDHPDHVEHHDDADSSNTVKSGDAAATPGHSDAPNTPYSQTQIDDLNNPAPEKNPDYATPNQPALGDATTAASSLVPNAPASPGNAVGPVEASDPRVAMAHDLASRGLSFASVNDLAKAVLLMLDLHVNPSGGAILDAINNGETPTLL